MTTRMPSARRACERLNGALLDRIGDGEQAGGLPVNGDQHDALAVSRSASALAGKSRRDRCRAIANSAALPTATRLPSTVPIDALAGFRAEVGCRGEREAALLGTVDDRGGERMLAAALEAGGEPQQLICVKAGPSGATADQFRLALGQGAGLVDDERVDFFHQFERLGIAHQHAGARAAAGADHDRHRRRQTERAGAGDDQHRDGIDKRKAHRRRRAEDRPDDKGRDRDEETAGTNQAATTSASRWIGARERCASATIRDDLRQQRVAADPLGAHDKAAGGVDRRAGDLVARALSRPAPARR